MLTFLNHSSLVVEWPGARSTRSTRVLGSFRWQNVDGVASGRGQVVERTARANGVVFDASALKGLQSESEPLEEN